MRKNNINTLRIGICMALVSALSLACLVGCGSKEMSSDTTIFEEMVPTADAPDFFEESEPGVYEDANGWTAKYDPEKFVVNQGGPITTFVYMGECAGTNMITATYTASVTAEDAINEIGASLGENARYWQSTFIGTEDVPGYWVVLAPNAEEGSGYGKTAIARDYMEGALVFEIDEHIGNDEMNNIEVSDALSSIIDSIQFPFES